MKTSWTRAGATMVKLFVVASLSFSGQVAPAYSFSEAWPRDQVESAEDTSLDRPSKDPFHLMTQRWELGTRNSKLSRLYQILGLVDMVEPVAVDKPPAFDKFLIEIEDEHLVIREAELARKGFGVDDESTDAKDLRLKQHGAAHHFDSIKPLRFSVDKDLLIVLDTYGVVHAIDLHLIKTVAYRAPVPVFRLHQIDQQLLADVGDDLEANFVTEKKWRELNAKPSANGLFPLDRPGNYLWQAGDWTLLRSNAGKSEVLVELDRDVILKQISAYETVLAYWSDLLHPRASNREHVEVNAEIPYEAALAISRMDRDTVRRLLPNAEAWFKAAQAPRDQFKMYGDDKFGVPTPGKMHRRITPRSMLAIASAVVGGTVMVEGMRRFGYDSAFAHGVRIVSSALLLLVPVVLTDAVYRRTLMKSAFWLGMVAPAIWATAALFGRLTGRKEDPRITWVRAGIRTFAAINQPFWRPMAHLLRQPHVVKALSLGVNPGREVLPDSPLGREAGLIEPRRLGWVNPFVFGPRRRKTVAETGQLLKAFERQTDDRITMAKWIALTAVSQESNVDPVTIALEEDSTDVRRTSADENQGRRELEYRLIRKLRQQGTDPHGVTPEDLAREVKLALEATRRLGERGLPEAYFERARYEWNQLSSGALRGLHEFARLDNNYWATAEPTKRMSARAFSIFVTDYYMGTPYVMLEGPRADLADPASLVAQEGAFMNTGPGARYDILDTPRWYSINHNAKFTNVFMGEAKLKADSTYDLRESALIKPNWRSPNPWEALVEFTKDMANPSTGEYGEIVLKQLQVAFAMIQTSYLLTTSARMIFAGSTWETSSLNFIYHFIWGHIQTGLFFDVINSTISRMENRYQNNRDRTQAALNAIGQGTRLKKVDQYRDGVAALLKLYEGRDHKFTPEMQRQLAEARETGPEVMQMAQANALMFAAQAEPPLPGKDPKWIMRTAYAIGVGLATYFGIKMSVPTFGHNVDWNYLIGSSLTWATAFYVFVYGATKAWRGHQKRQLPIDCEAHLAPRMPVSPVRAAAGW